MRSFILHHTLLFSVAGLMILGAGFMAWQVLHANPLAGLVTATVSRGTVEQIISVSGVTKAANTAELAFPTPGVVSKVYVKEGNKVAAGDILATLGAESLVAQRQSAEADVQVARANLAELLAGDTSENRTVRTTTIANATAEVARVKATGETQIANARRALLSNALALRAVNPENHATAPIVSGTYHCDKEGVYTITIYPSNTLSGYSMRYSGLETGSATLSSDQALPLGDCGLLLQITKGQSYANSDWTIDIPNHTATTYLTYKNALDATINTANAANASAQEALTLTTDQATAANATPRSEAVTRAEAQVTKSTAVVAQIDAALGDRVVRAPFAGTVTLVDILPGETAGAKPVFTVLATDNLELTARVPEIDVTHVALEEPVRVLFDADRSETHTGHVTYIAPLPIQIDGVAYFEVKITLDTTPTWLRGGLNADIDIITDSKENVLRVPKRYVTSAGDTSVIRTVSGTTIASTTVTKVFEGNDGYTAIDGVSEGTTVVTP
jgi:multidrug efflux pump subunit AcrA (membrane-fusion protein)